MRSVLRWINLSVRRLARTRVKLRFLELAAYCFLASLIGNELLSEPNSVATVWFASAIGIACMLRAPRADWPALMLAVAIGFAAAAPVTWGFTYTALGFALAHAVEVIVAVALIQIWVGRTPRLIDDIWTYVRLILASGVAAPIASGPLGAWLVMSAYGVTLVQAGHLWIEASLIGTLAALPVVLLLRSTNLRAIRHSRSWLIVAAMVLATIAVSYFAIIMPAHPPVLLGIPVVAAGLWIHPLASAIVALTAISAAAGWQAYLPMVGDQTGVLVTISVAVAAPFAVSLIVNRLRRDAARFRLAMDSSAVGMALVDVDGRWTRANRPMLDFLGCDDSDLSDLSWEKVTHADDLQSSDELRARLLSGQIDMVHHRKRYVRKDGQLVWGDVAISIVRDEITNAPLYRIVQIVDVTARVKAEAALAESERRHNFALESAGLGVWDCDIQTGRMYFSPACLTMFGFAPGERSEGDLEEWLRLLHPEDQPVFMAGLGALFSGRSDTFFGQYRVSHVSGHYIWVESHGKIVERDESGKPARATGINTDISGRKAAERALIESEQRWIFALESARQGVWDFDAVNNRSYYSDTWKAILGYEPHEIGDDGDLWKTLVHPDDLGALEQADREAKAPTLDPVHGYFEMEFRMRHKEGHWVWILDRGKVIERDKDGKTLRVIGTHTDITERRRSEERMKRLSQRVQLATKAGGVGLWEYHLADGGLWWDERMRALYGIGPDDDVSYDVWANALHPDDRERAEREVELSSTGERPYETEFRVVQPDGGVRHIRSMADFVRDEHGVPQVLVGTNWDVTQTQALTMELGAEKERLRVTLASIGDGVICTDTSSRITFMNRVAEIETGWPYAEAKGQSLETVFELVDEWTEAPVASPVTQCLRTKRPAESQDEVILVNRQGSRQDVRNTAAPIISDGGELLGAVLVFQDVTKARRMQRHLAYSATHDSLTDLQNRGSFERQLSTMVKEAADNSDVHALCFIDLDRFKIVNDTAGHAAGDQLLRIVARTIRSQIRSVDIAARLGGDEFALLFRDCPPESAANICRKILAAIGDLEFSFEGHTFRTGASIGLAAIDGAMTPSEVLSTADRACYDAKAAGRNQVRVGGVADADGLAEAG